MQTHIGGSITLYKKCKDFEINFMGRTFLVDLIVLGFEGFSIILGMDWLTKNHVTLDCARRTIHVNTPGLPHFSHTYRDSSQLVMSTFLYSVEIPKMNISEVEVVRDFEDVFQEIPGLPPRREVEFRIDLVPGTAPISKSAYRMAPKELEEMKKQLDEMLQKGCVEFLSNSNSLCHFESLVLFYLFLHIRLILLRCV